MSRSNTRSRRSQWKTTAADLTTCPKCKADKLQHVACPTVRCLQRPPVRGGAAHRARGLSGLLASREQHSVSAPGHRRRDALTGGSASLSTPSCSCLRSLTALSRTKTAACPPTSASSSLATPCSASSSPIASTATHPDLAEGDLAKMRAACVSQRALAVVARDLGPWRVRLARQGRDLAREAPTRTRSFATPSRRSLARSTWRTASTWPGTWSQARRPLARGGRDARRRPRLEDVAPRGVLERWLRRARLRRRWASAPTTRASFTAHVMVDGVARGTGIGHVQEGSRARGRRGVRRDRDARRALAAERACLNSPRSKRSERALSRS